MNTTNLVLLVAKGWLLLSVIENPWMWRLILMYDSRMAFQSTKQLVKEPYYYNVGQNNGAVCATSTRNVGDCEYCLQFVYEP